MVTLDDPLGKYKKRLKKEFGEAFEKLFVKHFPEGNWKDLKEYKRLKRKYFPNG